MVSVWLIMVKEEIIVSNNNYRVACGRDTVVVVLVR